VKGKASADVFIKSLKGVTPVKTGVQKSRLGISVFHNG
jgi:hypothetical protein